MFGGKRGLGQEGRKKKLDLKRRVREWNEGDHLPVDVGKGGGAGLCVAFSGHLIITFSQSMIVSLLAGRVQRELLENMCG